MSKWVEELRNSARHSGGVVNADYLYRLANYIEELEKRVESNPGLEVTWSLPTLSETLEQIQSDQQMTFELFANNQPTGLICATVPENPREETIGERLHRRGFAEAPASLPRKQIWVNATEITVEKIKMTYEELVQYSYPGTKCDDYTMIVQYPKDRLKDRIAWRGEVVDVVDGMRVTCVHTGAA